MCGYLNIFLTYNKERFGLGCVVIRWPESNIY